MHCFIMALFTLARYSCYIHVYVTAKFMIREMSNIRRENENELTIVAVFGLLHIKGINFLSINWVI